ncbi:MAG: alpha-glucan family phosphorylase [Candidatus Thorarchaeota archaeon]
MVNSKIIEKVPEQLKGLIDLAYNLWWSWNYNARKLWRELDEPLWHSTRHNPVKILLNIDINRLNTKAKNSHFMEMYNNVMTQFNTEMGDTEDLWWRQNYPSFPKEGKIAYLSMEYGVHTSLPIYSGGLGILSGDHLKESSDLGVPLVAIGFLYQEGYFIQKIPSHGWQEAIYKEMNFDELPITNVVDPTTGKPLLVPIYFNDITVLVKIWLVKVGRIDLYLMDSNTEENPPWDQDLTDRLYGGNTELRLKQEMILGFGAVRLLEKLNIKPLMFHLNEGHCSFSSIERIRQHINQGMTFEQALESVRKTTVFTTHTPVPAGHDVFPFNLMNTYFSKIINELGQKNLFSLGTYDVGTGIGFNMTVLGIKSSYHYNAVSKIHREVTLSMFEPLWKELKEQYGEKFNEIIAVTNGVHVPSFVSEVFYELFNIVKDNWVTIHDDKQTWLDMLDTITNNDIWEYHITAKERLFRLIRETARIKLQNGEWDSQMALVSGALLDPKVLTIGFARRFATYKRATLIFTDFNRLMRLVNDTYRPIQIVFSGKAHPSDDNGKKFIQEIINNAKNPKLANRVAFIEGYDLAISKIMLQGVDIWLNNPLKPNEASGTSGMKASLNFIPNFSVLDGWWAEGYNKENGWAINPQNQTNPDRSAQDWIDAKSLYEILENEIIPAYYNMEANENIPQRFIEIMRKSIFTAMTQFSAKRMLKEYAQNLYIPIIENSQNLSLKK